MSKLFFTPLKGKLAFLNNWQSKELTYEQAKSYTGCTGVGLVHGLSNTCCIDIDDVDLAREWFKGFKINMDNMLEKGFIVYSPNGKSGKAIFRLPQDVDLPKLAVKDEKKGIQFVEFRSGSHQDAWPGSQYHFRGMGFNEWGNTYYTTDEKWQGIELEDALPDLPIEMVKLWLSLVKDADRPGSNTKVSGDDNESIDSIIDTIVSGKEGLHDSINKYAYMQIADGVAPKVVEATLKGLMAAIPDSMRDKRWEEYMNDIPRSVSGAVSRIENEGTADDTNDSITMNNLPDIIEEGEFSEKMPWPPGMLGRLTQNSYDMQRYQYREVAIVSALGVIAGIAGRKFNISGTGLNVYLTLIMQTGMGKDSIREFVCGTINELNDTGSSSSFVGPGRFTGPKSVFSSLKNARCRVSVFTEAGLLLRSKAGDQDGLTRVLLQLYSCSGNNQFSMEEVYSKGEDSIEALQAPCLSIINEATPETLLQAFKNSGALENGHLPRQSIYRITGDKPYMNFAVKTGIDDDILFKLRGLVDKCSRTQSANDPAAWNLLPDEDVKDDVMRLAQYYTDIENAHRDSDSMKSIMASRCLLKALKFAALASVINHEDAVIHLEEWKWAKEMVAFEMSGVESFFRGGYSDDMDSIALGVVGNVILKILHNKYKDRQQQMNAAERRQGLVHVGVIRRILKNNRSLNEINDDSKYKSNPKSGIDKCLQYMVDNGYIRWHNVDKGRTDKRFKDASRSTIKITDMFNKAMEL